MSAKLPSMSPASGVKTKMAMTLEIKLKVMAQLQANRCVLRMCRVGEAKLRCAVGLKVLDAFLNYNIFNLQWVY